MSIVTKEYNNQVVEFDLSGDMMVSLTDMAKANGKRVSDWKDLPSTRSYLEALEKSDTRKSHIVIRKGGDSQLQGTWATKRVAIRFAQWLSDDFAIWVDTQIEELLTKGTVSIKTPQTYKEALLALIAKEEELERAIATKAEIGSRREATAMATASVAVKQANKLQIELDRSKEYCTIKRMTMLTHGQTFSFKLLRDASNEMNIPAIDIYDANYGTVKAYHKDVWLEVYGLDF